MFPIDDGSKPSFNVSSQRDVDTLLADPGWAAGYREAIVLAARAWGWDVDAAARVVRATARPLPQRAATGAGGD